jgi:hypothetical protein
MFCRKDDRQALTLGEREAGAAPLRAFCRERARHAAA